MEATEFLIKLFVSFVLLGVFFFGLLWFMKKRGIIPAFLTHGEGEREKIKVLSALRLTPKTYLFLVEVEGRKIMLGVSERSVNYITDIAERDTERTKGEIETRSIIKGGGRFVS